MTRGATRRGAAGFTLLELIVAVSILALIAVFSWRGLDSLIREREALAASQSTIEQVQRLFARIESDALAADDVALDADGTLVLLAGAGSQAGAAASAVRYRDVDGGLQRTVSDGGGHPLVVLGDVTTLTIEAWAPTGGGGAWVRTKQPAMERPATAATAPVNPASGAVLPSAPPAPASAPTSIAGMTAPASALPASAIRLSFTRAGGLPIVRTFLVGGG